MFWTNLKHSLDTNTTTHTDEQRSGGGTWQHNYRGGSRAGQSLSIMSERGPPTAEEDMKTFNQNNYVPALLAFNYILNTHTHTHLCRNTRVCALAIVKSCWNVAANLSEWKSGQQTRAPLRCHSVSQAPRAWKGGREEELCTRTMHGPGSFAISVCHFQNVPAAASYHCPLRMTVLPMFRLLSFCFQMLNTAVCMSVCVCVLESVCATVRVGVDKCLNLRPFYLFASQVARWVHLGRNGKETDVDIDTLSYEHGPKLNRRSSRSRRCKYKAQYTVRKVIANIKNI